MELVSGRLMLTLTPTQITQILMPIRILTVTIITGMGIHTTVASTAAVIGAAAGAAIGITTTGAVGVGKAASAAAMSITAVVADTAAVAADTAAVADSMEADPIVGAVTVTDAKT